MSAAIRITAQKGELAGLEADLGIAYLYSGNGGLCGPTGPALAKSLAVEPRVLILDEPTRGIDVGAKAEVHKMIADLADSGVSILMISSELTELLHVADRILVMHEGRLTADLPRHAADEETIMKAAVS